ncbi:MAG TPA: hypothetical protein VND70_05810 [Acidimicrobiales bacterium]|nr:hypothetical protein [Acidimicrobiales bacterium]
MASWGVLSAERPDLTEGGRQLLYQHHVGLAFLATIRPDGAPRLHPFCPLIMGDGIYGFIIPSPKQRDLRRDGRYSVHSFPTDSNEDAFSISGHVEVVHEASLRRSLGEQFVSERSEIGVPFPADQDLLVAFDIASCLLTRTTGFGDWKPHHEVWRETGPLSAGEL